MSDSLAPESPTVRAFDATVTRVDGRSVVLDETYFYPEGGGQPADRGVLGGVAVEHVRSEADGTIVHDLAADPDFGVGDEVTGVVDDDFRTYCMRAHTASHVLYGAGRRIFDDLGYGGFDISAEKVRVDFETSTEVDDDALVELERLVNRAVWDSREVSWEEIPVSEAREREEIAFNVKTEEGVFAESETVRVVSIDGWDWAACGGTHVSNTVEIGSVEVLGRSNPGEGLTRVEFAVGASAIDRRAAVRTSAYEAARALGTNLDGLGESAATVAAAREELESELADLKSEVLRSRLADFETVERDGLTWRVGAVSGFDANEVGDAAKEARDGADVVVAVGESDAPFVVVASAGDAAAGDVVAEVTGEFGGGGGGGPTFAQGGGLGAPADEVLAYLRD
ncbi:serine-tRNA(Ala) deacylase AlaX [Haloferax sp. Atlit-10N]|uniref:serine-tRNA(Ala) deacylase AlaX n=1 Tax=Haloferax TaxID=2251 RepID=UPI00067977B8|nr:MULTISPECIES: serine-tRNA(Ala) deacylase AlaX [Haloferax]RDZ44178.1 serine-tRNA(Ala) deacylase AlaX [Haloferax sp. Atlit-16N]RDZ47667.1 serine-tRNA(Ala) deacylase AlaX [Haloferax sp. Atlit-19N]RDZ58223.1 serine-tRNA(Ala) deacylase AlaX [Haloferax sp. Atlit-10N]